MGDDGDGVAKGPGDGDESVKRQETNMLQTAAEEEVRNAPERVEDGFVHRGFLFNDVGGVDEDDDGQANTAVEKVHHAEALDTEVGHSVQPPVEPAENVRHNQRPYIVQHQFPLQLQKLLVISRLADPDCSLNTEFIDLVTPFLPWFYGAAKAKRLKIVLPDIK